MLPKAKVYGKIYDGLTKWVYFLIENVDLLETQSAILDKVRANIKKETESEPVYNKTFIKPK